MSALKFILHSKTPEGRKIDKIIEMLNDGAVILYPADTDFALGCNLSNKDAISRIRGIRRLPDHKEMTFICDSLSNVAEFAKVSNPAYKMIKSLIPGPFTFILPASKLVPKFAQDSKRRTAGIRVPDNILCKSLLYALGSPIISITARKEDDTPYENQEEMFKSLNNLVDVIITSDEYHFVGASTIIDMTTDEFSIIRDGAEFERVREYISEEE